MPNKHKYEKQMNYILTNLKCSQQYWTKIMDLMVDNRKISVSESSVTKRPRELYLQFMQYIIYKNSGYSKNVKPPGLSPVTTLANIFFCSARHMETILMMNKPFSEFPYPCFFIR